MITAKEAKALSDEGNDTSRSVLHHLEIIYDHIKYRAGQGERCFYNPSTLFINRINLQNPTTFMYTAIWKKLRELGYKVEFLSREDSTQKHTKISW